MSYLNIVSDHGFRENVKHRNGKIKQTGIKPSVDSENLSILEEGAGSKSDTNTDDRELLRQEQQRRIRHIRDACANESLFRNKVYTGKSSLLYYYSSGYNFSYCKVPKAGCSFWTQVFAILRKGTEQSDKVFGMTRKNIHRKLKNGNKLNFGSKTQLNSQSVLVSRDPFSRLFSAFIDKMFLPLFYGLAIQIVKRQRNLKYNALTCANDITFQEFLDDLIQNANQGKTLNRHWAPIISLCKPCEVNALSLVKQESFSTDVEYTLKEIGISDEEYAVIHDALHDHRIESTIPGIVQTVLTLSFSSRRCMTRIEVARRIWKSFQIQGYLKDNIPFPRSLINTETKAKSAKYLSDVILRTIRDNPLTSDESKRQRRHALETAYKHISERTIRYIQDIYKQDFVLFDYPLEPPSAK